MSWAEERPGWLWLWLGRDGSSTSRNPGANVAAAGALIDDAVASAALVQDLLPEA